MDSEEVRITLRLPAELHALITEQAKAESRSMNNQIVYMLKQSTTKKADEQKRQAKAEAKEEG